MALSSDSDTESEPEPARAPSTKHSTKSLQDQLSQAAERGETERVCRLLSQGANPNGVDWCGQTALGWAAHSNQVGTMEVLVAAGARVNDADEDGKTPLERAAYIGASDAVEYLLQNRSLDAATRATALDIARQEWQRYDSDVGGTAAKLEECAC